MNYLNLKTTDPAFNLAVEEYVFEQLPRDRMYVMLWQNDNAIIIGKNQNTLAEINEAYVKEQGAENVGAKLNYFCTQGYDKPTKKAKKNSFNNFEQRNYDYEELERMLLARN